MVVGAVTVYLFGQDSFWPVLVGAILTGALAGGVDVVLNRFAAVIGRYMRVSQMAIVVLAAVGVALFYRSEKNAAFMTAFGERPPAGVSRVDIEELIASDTGRHLEVIEFQASAEGIKRLIEARKFVAAPEIDLRPGKEGKAQRSVWNRGFSRFGASVVDRWKTRMPVLEPMIYHWTGTDRETLGEQTSILWDASSGRGCAIHGSS
jgi:hypothetical protein